MRTLLLAIVLASFAAPAVSQVVLSPDEIAMINGINWFRDQHELSPLTPDASLMLAARERAPYYDHNAMGMNHAAHARRYGFYGGASSEIIASGQRTSEDAVTAWIRSKRGHNGAMRGNYNAIGVGAENRKYCAIMGRTNNVSPVYQHVAAAQKPSRSPAKQYVWTWDLW